MNHGIRSHLQDLGMLLQGLMLLCLAMLAGHCALTVANVSSPSKATSRPPKRPQEAMQLHSKTLFIHDRG
jgi:hypothetical protein